MNITITSTPICTIRGGSFATMEDLIQAAEKAIGREIGYHTKQLMMEPDFLQMDAGEEYDVHEAVTNQPARMADVWDYLKSQGFSQAPHDTIFLVASDPEGWKRLCESDYGSAYVISEPLEDPDTGRRQLFMVGFKFDTWYLTSSDFPGFKPEISSDKRFLVCRRR